MIGRSSAPIPVIGITETWLKPYIKDPQVGIKDYRCLRADRENRKGGGVMLYVHDSLLTSNELCHTDKYSSLASCFIDSMDTIIGTIYRPPDAPLTSFTDSLEMLQTQINSLSKNNRMPDIYIMGDFNLPAIDWESGQIDSGQPLAIQQACHKLINFAETNFLTQVVDHPTRGGNTLDLIFTNKVQDVCNSKAYETLLSDHQLIELTLSYNPLKPKEDFKQEIDLHSFRAVDVHSADYNSINDLLADVDWDKVKDDVGNDPDGSNFLATITETVLEAVLKHSPLKTGAMEKPHRKSQTTSKTKYPRTVRERRRLKQNRRKINSRIRAVQNNNPESPILPKLKEEVALIGYKIQQNILNRLQKREANAVEKIRSNPRFFYSFAKQFAKARSSVAPLQDSTGRLHDNPEKKAELLQEQYVKVFSNPEVADTIKATENIRVKRSANAFNNISFGPEDIVAAIKELDPYSATPDGDIPARVLCSCREQISYPLFLLWRDSLNSGQIPPSLKHQYITPVFKKGDKTKAENYRPVSITSHLIKVFERLLRVRLVAFLEDNAFLSKHQHGFRKEQTVVVEGTKSRPQKVRSGVPQGTVLGPILFILYINDQLDILRYCLGKIFADDTKLIGRICSMLAKEKLQEDLLGVIAWACANNMQLNESKFEVLNYTLNQSNWLRTLPFHSENYIYHTSDGTPLEPSSTVKDLGVLVSSDRSWSPHIFKTVNSARTMAAWILSVFSDRSPTLMVTLYKSMVRCRLEYCCPLWNPSKIGQIESIERIQREFTRRISGCKDLNYWERLKKLKLMSLQRRRERYMIIQVWKIINGQAPNCTEMEFKENERLGTRAIVPSIPRAAQCSVRTDYEHSFGVKAAQLWNILPKTIKEASTITQLKISLGDFLDKTPDFPPTQGYTARNNNSLLEWNLCNRAGTLDGGYGWSPLRQTS
ncbi:hypothetical protein ACHWQZ_G016198 [Mnemiopsis leidyi]